MKRIVRPLYLSFAVGFILASCGSQKMISTPVENIDKLPLKTTPVAENDLKRWSHLDLVNDTVPGMSVDKAYKEIIKGKKGKKKSAKGLLVLSWKQAHIIPIIIISPCCPINNIDNLKHIVRDNITTITF